ncbi:MAG: NusG domain II-containing protein [Deltaproteobacteria bacterium]|nr:NusG domain II-containing protein [Deltaproteobacteria bacterium]
MTKYFKANRADLILIIGVLAVAFVWAGVLLGTSPKGDLVEIHNSHGLYVRSPLKTDTTITVPGPLGQSVVVIQDGKVFMQSSPCPNKLCIHMGPIEKAGRSIVCIPNRVYMVIKGKSSGIDAVTY